MRLPWPSRRTARTAGAAAPAASTGALRPTDAPLVRRSEWREVGGLRPSFQAHLGVSVQRFGAGLSGSQRPDPMLQPLGHERTADGPAGLVSGLTRPVVARVQLGGHVAGGSLPLARARVAADVAASIPEPDAPAAGPSEPVSMTTRPELPTVTPRRVPAVTGAPVAAGPLTVAPPPAPASLLVPATPVPAIQRSPRTEGPGRAPGVPADHVQRSPEANAAGAPMRTILRSSGRSRVRLGPALDRTATGPLDLATVQRPEAARGPEGGPAGADTGAGAHAPAPPVADEGGRRGTHPADDVPTARTSPAAWSPPRGLVVARLASTPASGPGTGPAPRTPSSPSSPTSPTPAARLERTAGRAPASTAPVVGTWPLRPTDWPLAPARGAAGPGGIGSGGNEPASSGISAPRTGQIQEASSMPPARPVVATTARMVAEAQAPSAVRAPRHAPMADMASTPVIQRRAAALPSATPAPAVAGGIRGMTQTTRISIPAGLGPLDRGAGRAVLAHEQVHVRQQRALGDRMPAPGSESAHRLEAEARRAEASVAWEELTLAHSPARPAMDAPTGAALDVARPMELPSPTVHDEAALVAQPWTQHAAGDAPAPAPDSSAASGAAAGGAGMATPPSDRDLEEMLRRLYPRLRRQLSSELLVARERAGVLADRR